MQHEQGIEYIGKQFIEEPTALVDTKGEKQAITQTRSSRYKLLRKFLMGCFLSMLSLSGKHLSSTQTFYLKDTYHVQGTLEVHIVFDRQYGEFNPKQWECHRDSGAEQNQQDPHVHTCISSKTDTSPNWRALETQASITYVSFRKRAQLYFEGSGRINMSFALPCQHLFISC